MNILSIVKMIFTTGAVIACFSLNACIQPVAPQQTANRQNQTGANPYAVPGLNEQQQLPNAPDAKEGSSPYQPLPNIPAVPQVAQSQSTQEMTHNVVRGDTLWGISKKYGVSIEAIQSANGLDSTSIWAGQTLTIPAGN